ncbi:hypothetical protein HU200_013368 [Digitaria exilis]|uniref:RING-type E3 ubiquitin transferase n=1 Tax=Digitaria exilis TaxID=1010633 RepID=A0A835FE99_9POAL|nr:hypothetical protein HU200_013368 [Digitaria exilis]
MPSNLSRIRRIDLPSPSLDKANTLSMNLLDLLGSLGPTYSAPSPAWVLSRTSGIFFPPPPPYTPPPPWNPPPPPPPPPTPKPVGGVIAGVSIAVAILPHPWSPPEPRQCCRRRSRRRCCIPHLTAADLPSFTYKQSVKHNVTGAGEEAATCSVCLGVFQNGEMVRLLPVCLHLYHVECIDPWLEAHSSCPICRAGMDPAVDGGQLPPTLAAVDPCTFVASPDTLTRRTPAAASQCLLRCSEAPTDFDFPSPARQLHLAGDTTAAPHGWRRGNRWPLRSPTQLHR